VGHISNPDKAYRLLQQRLDKHVTGAPASPTFMKILRLLFTEDEAKLAVNLPGTPTASSLLAKKLHCAQNELDEKMSALAARGVVVDLAYKGEHYYALPPVVIGFFEYTFMRTRDALPMKEMARLFDEYMNENDRFAASVFGGKTQLGRTLAHEEALPQSDFTEILDWERSSAIIENATQIAVSLCTCRHKASHLDKSCGRLEEACLTLNYSADTIIRNGMGREINVDEAQSILEKSKEQGLAQTGDNVQHQVSYICNCCGCCCGMMEAIKTFNQSGAIVTSNWMARVDMSQCNGCGLCVAACPVGAVSIEGEGTRIKSARVDEAACLGCGVCVSVCKRQGVALMSRAQRVYTPETVFDQRVSMAIERGKLADMIFENPSKLSHRALGRVMTAIEKSDPVKGWTAAQSVDSQFFKSLVKIGKKMTGEVGTLFD